MADNSNSGALVAIVAIIAIVLLLLFFFTRGFGDTDVEVPETDGGSIGGTVGGTIGGE